MKRLKGQRLCMCSLCLMTMSWTTSPINKKVRAADMHRIHLYGVKVRSSTAPRTVSVKNLVTNVTEDLDDETGEVWKEQDYVDVLGTDIQDPGGGNVYSFYTIKRSNKMALLGKVACVI
ncbi:hypothetical protein FKM82_023719 [Ascaphus truei]